MAASVPDAREPRLTLHRREGEAWTAIEARRGATLEVASLAARLIVDELYRDGPEDA